MPDFGWDRGSDWADLVQAIGSDTVIASLPPEYRPLSSPLPSFLNAQIRRS